MTAPIQPTAAPEAAVMAQVESVITATVFDVLRALTLVWNREIGTTGTKPPDPLPDFVRATLERAQNDLIAAITRAGEQAEIFVPGTDTAHARDFRIQRVRDRLDPAYVAQRGFAAVHEGVAQAKLVQSDIRGQVSQVLVTEHTQSILDRARELGGEWRGIWVPERDACVRCLAYAGRLITPGLSVSANLSLGKPVGDTRHIAGPPLHPHCRCELKLIRVRDAKPQADVLRREAARSAVKGWSRPSESDSVRAEAARRVLTRKIVLPKSVIAETRKRLRAPKEFARRAPRT